MEEATIILIVAVAVVLLLAAGMKISIALGGRSSWGSFSAQVECHTSIFIVGLERDQ